MNGIKMFLLYFAIVGLMLVLLLPVARELLNYFLSKAEKKELQARKFFEKAANANAKKEAFCLDENIEHFCKQYLSPEEISMAEEITKGFFSSEEKKEYFIGELRERTGDTPKRPMYYIHRDIKNLPDHTRDIVRYAGDYIDHLVKFAASDILKNKKYQEKSLGANAKKLKNIIPDELYENLCQYNDIIYVPAKHSFSVKGRQHLITTREAVYILISTVNLGKEIIRLSNLAKEYAENKIIA
jgi:hypothetical protein